MLFYHIWANFANKNIECDSILRYNEIVNLETKPHTLTGAIHAAPLACPFYVSTSPENPLADYLARTRADSVQQLLGLRIAALGSRVPNNDVALFQYDLCTRCAGPP